jgi:hypothetical protein
MSKSDSDRAQSAIRFIVDCLARKNQDIENKSIKQLDRVSGREVERFLDRSQNPQRLHRLESKEKLSTGDVVGWLSSLRTSLKEKHGAVPAGLISAEQIFMALQKLVTLTPVERKALNITGSEHERLVQQIILNLYVYQQPWTREKLLNFYRISMDIGPDKQDLTEEGDVDDWIQSTLRDYENIHLACDENEQPAAHLNIKEKVTREINRILLQTGVGQISLSSINGTDNYKVSGESNYKKKYVSYGFVRRLTHSVFENELLTKIFPIFLQNITIETAGPFPLQVSQDFLCSHGVIVRKLLDFDKKLPNQTQITSYSVNQVKVQFYLKPSKIEGIELMTSACQIVKGSDGGRIIFEMSSRGIGSVLSHIIRALNHTLLYDKDCLKEYFPIAQDIILEKKAVHGDLPSPVVAHNLVSLCKAKTLSAAMEESRKKGCLVQYDEFSFDDPIGRGDYCAFDMILGMAHAALQARLRAIKRTTKLPEKYIYDLVLFINYSSVLKQAESYVRGYPFSSLAQESYIRSKFLDNEAFSKPHLSRQDPCVIFDACLALAETFLHEGAYRKAQRYLRQVEDVINDISENGIEWYDRYGDTSSYDDQFSGLEIFQVFSGALTVRYELCRANLCYLKGNAIQAWKHLERAEKHLTIRLLKYTLIGEVSQGTLHPHHILLSNIDFMRAKIMLFFPHEIPVSTGGNAFKIETDSPATISKGKRMPAAINMARLFYMERARLYAGCDGDSEMYSLLTAYQSVFYLIVSLLPKPISEANFSLNKEQAFLWAEKLRNESLTSYTSVGRKYYYEIKEKSGIDEGRLKLFGQCKVSPIPAIQEIVFSINYDELPGISQSEDAPSILQLDMNFLALDKNMVEGNINDVGEPIYLFGSTACYLFFARGLYHLRSNFKDEFDNTKEVITLDEWNQKINYCYCLFSYAWAIAADGGNVTIIDGKQLRIQRDFTRDSKFNRHVASVRDMYPHRVADIAPLGRIFAAFCMVLQLYTSRYDQEKRIETLEWLLNDFSLVDNEVESNDDILDGQIKFDNHLDLFIENSKKLIWEMKDEARVISDPKKLKESIDRNLKKLVDKLSIDEQ